MTNLSRVPIAKLFGRASATYTTFEILLIDELVAGNAIAGTPLAACGRVALGMACAVARDLLSKSAAPLDRPALA